MLSRALPLPEEALREIREFMQKENMNIPQLAQWLNRQGFRPGKSKLYRWCQPGRALGPDERSGVSGLCVIIRFCSRQLIEAGTQPRSVMYEEAAEEIAIAAHHLVNARAMLGQEKAPAFSALKKARS